MEQVSTDCLPGSRAIQPPAAMTAAVLLALLLAACGRTSAPVVEPPPTAESAFAAGTAMTVTTGISGTLDVTGTGELAAGEATPPPELPSTEEIQRGAAAAEEAVTADNLRFLHPTDNAVVPLTFTLAISYTDLDLGPGAGQLYLLVDSAFVEPGSTMPTNAFHVPLRGARSAQVSIPRGSHVLRLQYADANNIAVAGDEYRQEIVVNAVEGAPAQNVRIVTPTDGAIVPPTFEVIAAAAGLDIVPAGTPLAGGGHLHLILNAPYVAPGEVIPTNAQYLHLDQGQVRGSIALPPGDHLIRLQVADSEHRALAGNPYRAEVRVRVEEGAPANQVRIVKPAQGATVSSPFTVVWAATGLIIEQAGQSIRPGAGHLHLLINEEFVPGGELIPTDATHLHFGQGQTHTDLTLEPGTYTLRLQMANGGHLAHAGAQYQDEITVTVR